MRTRNSKEAVLILLASVLVGCQAANKDPRTDGQIYEQVSAEFTQRCTSAATPFGTPGYVQCREANRAAEHRRFAEIRLGGGGQPSTSSSDPVGDVAETAGRVTGFLLESAFYLALGAASAPPRGGYSGGNLGNSRGISNTEMPMHCTSVREGPMLGTRECGCNSNNQYFTSIIVQGIICPSFILYDVKNNVWRER